MKDAEEHFGRGVELYKDGDSGGALVEFKRAYELSPNYRVLYNMGQPDVLPAAALCRMRSRRCRRSSSRRPCLRAGSTPDKRASVENDVRQLQNRVGQVEVKVNVDGAQILVDDEQAGHVPARAQPATVSVGHRQDHGDQARDASAQDRFVDVGCGAIARASSSISRPRPPPGYASPRGARRCPPMLPRPRIGARTGRAGGRARPHAPRPRPRTLRRPSPPPRSRPRLRRRTPGRGSRGA